MSHKDLLKAASADKRYPFLLADGSLRGVILNATLMTNQLKANHTLGVLETLALGHAAMGGALMAAGLKGNDRIRLQIDCSGPLKGLSVEANAFGEVRGFLKAVPIPVAEPPERFDIAPLMGEGMLSVTRYIEDAKQPFTGQTALGHGAIALELANYFLVSEQIPTAFSLSVHFRRDGWVAGAGGLLLQAMPGAEEDAIRYAEELVRGMPSIGKAMAADPRPWPLVEKVFAPLNPQLLVSRRIGFMCHCREKTIENMIQMLPQEELQDLAQNGPFPLEIRCHNCSTLYRFGKGEIRRIAQRPGTAMSSEPKKTDSTH